MTDPHDTPVHLTPRALAIAVGVRDDEGLRDHRLRARVLGEVAGGSSSTCSSMTRWTPLTRSSDARGWT